VLFSAAAQRCPFYSSDFALVCDVPARVTPDAVLREPRPRKWRNWQTRRTQDPVPELRASRNQALEVEPQRHLQAPRVRDVRRLTKER